jgi:hypothetical protein
VPPTLTFQPIQAQAADRPGPAELDLAGDRRPRCAISLPQASEPGLWRGECGCGASFAVGVAGTATDPKRLLLPCWERREHRPPQQRNLL